MFVFSFPWFISNYIALHALGCSRLARSSSPLPQEFQAFHLCYSASPSQHTLHPVFSNLTPSSSVSSVQCLLHSRDPGKHRSREIYEAPTMFKTPSNYSQTSCKMCFHNIKWEVIPSQWELSAAVLRVRQFRIRSSILWHSLFSLR